MANPNSENPGGPGLPTRLTLEKSTAGLARAHENHCDPDKSANSKTPTMDTFSGLASAPAVSSPGLSRRAQHRAFMREVTSPCLNEEVVSQAFQIWDFSKSPSKQKKALEELEKLFGLQNVSREESIHKASYLPSKLFESVNAIAEQYGFVGFHFDATKPKGRTAVLSVSPSAQEFPKPPYWLEGVEIEQIKRRPFRLDHVLINEGFESGARLSEVGGDPMRSDSVTYGSLGCIMTDQCHDTGIIRQPCFFGLTAGHVLPDDAVEILCESPTDSVVLPIVSRFQRLRGKPVYGFSYMTFANEVGILKIPPQSISSFVHKINNANPFFFGPIPSDNDPSPDSNPPSGGDSSSDNDPSPDSNPPSDNNPPSNNNPLLDNDSSSDSSTFLMEVSDFQDVLFTQRRRYLDELLISGQRINVFKKGSSTDLTVGNLVRTLRVAEADKVYYEEGLDRGSDGGRQDVNWVGVVAWLDHDYPFAVPGDSGSLVYADERGVRVPLGIHIGSITEDKTSYFLSLEAFVERAEKEGLPLYFTT